MKKSDILSAVKKTDKKYVIEAAEENVKKKFSKKSFKDIISAVASVAALAAFAVFIVVTVSLANRHGGIAPTANDTGEDTVIENTVAEDTVTENTVAEDATEEDTADNEYPYNVTTEPAGHATPSDPEPMPEIIDSGEFKAVSGAVSFTKSTATVKATLYDAAYKVTAENSVEAPVYELEAEPAEPKPAADFDVFVYGKKFLREKDRYKVMRRTDHTMLTEYENGQKKWVYDLLPEEYITNWFDISDGTIVTACAKHVFMIRKLDRSGNLLWDHRVDSAHQDTRTDTPISVYEKDGRLYMLSVEYNGYYSRLVSSGPKKADVIVRVLSSETGELIKKTSKMLRITKNETSTACLYACDDGFVFSNLTDERDKDIIVYIGLDGTVKRIFTLETEGVSYYYYNATMQGSRMYLSAIALKDGAVLKSPISEEIERVGYDLTGVPDAELLAAAKAERSAALIAVDLGSCTVRAIYSAEAGFGGIIKENKDGFVWQLCKINGGFVYEPHEEFYYSLFTASSSDCAFTKDGELHSVTPSDTAYTQIEPDQRYLDRYSSVSFSGGSLNEGALIRAE